jgi:hypothetical protein
MKFVSAREIEESETLLDEIMEELDANPEEVYHLSHEPDGEVIAVLTSVNNQVMKGIVKENE